MKPGKRTFEAKSNFVEKKQCSGWGRGDKAKHILFKTKVSTMENLGVGLQTAVFLTKNKVLARVGVAGMNVISCLLNTIFARKKEVLAERWKFPLSPRDNKEIL